MSRDIKFRAWDKISPKMYVGHSLSINAGGSFSYLDTDGQWKDFFDDERIVVMQFTGLKDKNGKDIYEGDVGEIKSSSGRYEHFVVKWGIHRREMKSGWTVDIPGFCFEVDGFASFPIVNNYLNGHDLDIIEIIGNIYEGYKCPECNGTGQVEGKTGGEGMPEADVMFVCQECNGTGKILRTVNGE